MVVLTYTQVKIKLIKNCDTLFINIVNSSYKLCVICMKFKILYTFITFEMIDVISTHSCNYILYRNSISTGFFDDNVTIY